ncbi:LuxR C-terminal-related transcriptional regulator [Paraburkholderia sp. A2WS-5]|uniref:LuxR C-terminal-related transcriptional regulator n=1 Tax=unclassified Paraburkholderia TaxID=2615204 RepID=UPI003B7E3BBA
MARIIVASGRPVELNALADIVRATGHEVVGEADTAREALSLQRYLNPALIVVSADLPMFNAPDFVRRLEASGPRARTLLYGDEEAQLLVRGAFDAGVDGFVGRHENVEELRRAVAAILSGHRYFPRRDGLAGTRRKPNDAADPLAVLTEREKTVMAYLARGMSNGEIANELALSHKTVSAHRSRLIAKLGVRSIIDLAQIAQRFGLVGENAAAAVGGPQLHGVSERDDAVLQNLLDGTPLPLHVRDTEGRLVACNKTFLDLHHTTFEAAAGTRFGDLSSFDESTAREMDERYQTYVAAGKPMAADRRWGRNGQQTSMHVWMTPYRNERGELLGMICGSIDLTGREELASLLALERDGAEAVAEGATRMLEALCEELGTIGALLRTLHKVIFVEGGVGNSALEQQTAFAAGRLERLVPSITDLLALEHGAHRLVFGKISPQTVVRDVVDALQPGARARGCTLTLNAYADADVPVMLDGERFFKALYLLLGRQIVTCMGGAVRVDLDVRNWTSSTYRMTLEITQSPVAAAPQHDEPIREAGSHLAWLLCRRFVELMRGSLTTTEFKQGTSSVTMRFLVSAA